MIAAGFQIKRPIIEMLKKRGLSKKSAFPLKAPKGSFRKRSFSQQVRREMELSARPLLEKPQYDF